ncbi:hypothetical protein HF086_008224 [Spodoptera exigua]|uniref:Uncharacterized protein n=1 Tax=Spodoptera exigua TaxID=7107 RepID=A0A922SHC5_SPOEX|nr:hypothetical protein HF086_008224 [Spodoptera exigua]
MKRRDSNELIINDYDFEEQPTNQRTCKTCRVADWHAFYHHMSNTPCGHCMDMRIGVAKVSKDNEKTPCTCCPKCSQQQKRHPPCQQTLLEQAMEYLYSLVYNHRTQCERCNPKPPPCDDSAESECTTKKTVCPGKNANSDEKPTCPDASQNTKSSWRGFKQRSCKSKKPSPPCPGAEQPCNEQPCPNAEQQSCAPEQSHQPCPEPTACQHCPAAKTNIKNDEDDLNPNDSHCCKETMFEIAKAYLQKMLNAHQSTCPHCKQQLACAYAKDLFNYLREMMEQAWIYTKKYYEQVCQQDLEPASCNAGILKYPSSRTPCACDEPNVEEPPCPPPPEENCQAKRDFTPCCLHNSKGAEPSYPTSGTHNKSCCLSRNLHSHAQPYDDSYEADVEVATSECSLNKESFNNIHARDVIGVHTTNCANACNNNHVPTCSDNTDSITNNDANACTDESKNKTGNVRRKLGLSLSMEPNDHRFCTRPDECKHSKESLNDCGSPSEPPADEEDSCTTPIQPECMTNEQAEQADLPCTGGCKKCNTPNAIPTMCERRKADDEFKAFFDEQLGKIERRLKDKETLCRSDCNCLTCITNCKTGW